MADFRFYLKDKNSVKETQIRLHIHYRNKIAKVYIGEKIHPHHWNPATQRAKQIKKFPLRKIICSTQKTKEKSTKTLAIPHQKCYNYQILNQKNVRNQKKQNSNV